MRFVRIAGKEHLSLGVVSKKIVVSLLFENPCSSVAQSVERVAVNHHVRGSSPRWGARIKKPNF